MHPLALLEPVHVARRQLGHGHERGARVTHVGQADRVPGALGGDRLAGQLVGDVVADGGDHGFDHVAGLGRAGGHGRGLDRRNRHADAGGEDVPVFLAALEFVDQHEAARVAQLGHGGHRVHTLEGGQHHGHLERHLVFLVGVAEVVKLGHEHLAGFDLGGLGVGDPLHVAVAQLGFEHRLAVADAAEAQVADVGLAGDEGDRHLVAQLALAQVGVEDEGELVGRSEAAGHGHRADHHRARVLQEFLVVPPERLGMVDGTDRVGVPAMRAGARHLVETQLRPGGDDQVVVGQHLLVGRAARQHQLVARGVQGGHRLGDELDALALQQRPDLEHDFLALAPADRQPGVGRHELEEIQCADHGDGVFLGQQFAHFVGGGHAADAGAHDDDVGHVKSPQTGWKVRWMPRPPLRTMRGTPCAAGTARNTEPGSPPASARWRPECRRSGRWPDR